MRDLDQVVMTGMENQGQYPAQRVRQATLDDESRRILFQIRKRVFPCLPTCKVFLEKVKVLALML